MTRVFLVIFGCFVLCCNSFGQVKEDDKTIDSFQKKLKKFKDHWIKESQKNDNSYTYVCNVESYVGKIITTVKVKKGKLFSRKVVYNSFRGRGLSEVLVDETAENINTAKSGTRAKLMEDCIKEIEQILKDYKAGVKQGHFYFGIKGLSIYCIVVPYMVADHPGDGVRISSFEWDK